LQLPPQLSSSAEKTQQPNQTPVDSNKHVRRRWLIFVLCLIAVLIPATFLAFKVSAKPTVESVKTATPQTITVIKPAKIASYRGLPIRLKIPAIGVDTAIEYMGNTAGDTLLVIDAKGQSASFTVREAKTYDPKQQHDEVFNSASGTHLNLITCAGDWDSSHQHYLKRLVVFADLSPAI
jgi:hypothetical protein